MNNDPYSNIHNRDRCILLELGFLVFFLFDRFSSFKFMSFLFYLGSTTSTWRCCPWSVWWRCHTHRACLSRPSSDYIRHSSGKWLYWSEWNRHTRSARCRTFQWFDVWCNTRSTCPISTQYRWTTGKPMHQGNLCPVDLYCFSFFLSLSRDI